LEAGRGSTVEAMTKTCLITGAGRDTSVAHEDAKVAA
jgi:hypothetical protein